MLDLDDLGPDYQLVWPRDLFADELRAVVTQRNAQSEDVRLVLTEAFAGGDPAQDLAQAQWNELPPSVQGWWDGGMGSPQHAFVEFLLGNVDRLTDHATPRPYWSTRRNRNPAAPDAPEPDLGQFHAAWISLIGELQAVGYLDKVAPKVCVDDSSDEPPPEVWLRQQIQDRLGRPVPWPPGPPEAGAQYEDTLFDLVEVFHDLVARPRSRSVHNFADCGWHFSNFAYRPGQRLYRWKVNALLKRAGLDLELAGNGEDKGRLVHSPSDPRRDLVERSLQVAKAAPSDPRGHAISLFRARTASRHDKTSACLALVGILEQRRSLLKRELLSKDEGALFDIANNYALRHQRADQHPDYSDAYLDWVFWLYLSTIDLIDTLIARNPATGDRTA